MRRDPIERLESRRLLSSEFSWEMVPTYGVDDNNNGLIDINSSESLGYLTKGRFPVRFSYTGSSPTTSMSYYIDGDNFPVDLSHTFEDPGTHLRAELPEGIYDVTLRAYGTSGIVAEESLRIRVENELIVSLGDSYASGEGNPERPVFPLIPSGWADDPLQPSWFTHRTSLAASSRAAIDLEQADPHTSVTFLFLAESGGQLSGEEEGKNVLPDPTRPNGSQLERLKSIVGDKMIDQLIISIGGNDIGFSSAIATLIGNFNDPSDMPDTSAFSTLAAKYASLDNWIDLNLHVRNIYLQQYPNLLKDETGTYPIRQAGDIAFNVLGLEITAWEAQWAETNLLNRLTSIQAQAARDAANDSNVPASLRANNPSAGRPWNYVDTLVDKFATHGYDAPGGHESSIIPNIPISAPHITWELNGTASPSTARWIRTANESRSIEEPTMKSRGMMHPNTLGQIAIAEELEKAIEAHPAPAPAADAGGPYNITKGNVLTVTAGAAFAHDPVRQAAVIYAWDLDGDGVYGEQAINSIGDERSRSVTIDSNQLIAGISKTLRVHVYDPIDNTEAYAAAALAVNPSPPNIRLVIPPTAEEGVPASIAVDVMNSTVWREHYISNLVINWGDGPSQTLLVSGQAQYVDLGNGQWADRFNVLHTYVHRGTTNAISVEAVEELYANSGTRTWGPYTGSVSVVAPPSAPGSISGRVVWDQYPDAQFTAIATAENGWRSDSGQSLPVYIDANDNGTRDLGERWAQADGDGYYVIPSVAAGRYRVRVENDYYLSYFTNNTSNGRLVTVGSSPASGNDFYLTHDDPIGATVWRWVDRNGNGFFDTGERVAASGVPILFDANANRRQDPGERVLLTDELGQAYQFLYDPGAYYYTVPLISDPSVQISPNAVLPDGSFEEYSNAPWQNLGGIYGSSNGTVNSGPVQPTAGSAFKSMFTGTMPNGFTDSAADIAGWLGVPAAQLDALGDPNRAATEGEATYRSIYAHAGSVISFDWNFLTTVAPGGDRDFGFASLTRSDAKTLIELSNVAATLSGGAEGDFARSSGWQHATITVPVDGWYTLGFGVLDENTATGDTALLLDNVQLLGTPASMTIPPYSYGQLNDFEVDPGTAAVAGNAWVDADRNGVRGATEPALANVQAVLVASGLDNQLGTSDDVDIAQITTDEYGTYAFPDLSAGLYGVRFVAPSGYGLTAALVGADRTLDSDPDPLTGRTSVFAVPAGGRVDDRSVGLIDGAFGVHVNIVGGGTARTNEIGGTASIAFSLSAQPSSAVTLPIWSSDVGEGTVSITELTFTPANWNVPQVVTVRGVDDSLFDGTVSYGLQIDPLVSADLRFNGLTLAPVPVVNDDSEQPLTADPLDPNDTVAAATVISTTPLLRSDLRIWTRGESDWFRFTASASGRWYASIAFIDSLGDLDLAAYPGDATDAAAQPLAVSDQFGQNRENLSFDVAAGQSYLVRVAGATPHVTNPNYSLVLGAEPTVQRAEFLYAATTPRVELQFSTPMAAGLLASDVSVLNTTTGQSRPVASVTAAPDGYTLLIGLGNGPLPDGNYQLVLPGAAVRSTVGIPMDAQFSLSFFSLAGDANHDRNVDFSDLLILAKNYGRAGMSFSEGDFDYDGNIGFSDLLILAKRYTVTLAMPPLGPAEASKPKRERATDELHF